MFTDFNMPAVKTANRELHINLEMIMRSGIYIDKYHIISRFLGESQ
jgi:hypothetical protein